MLPFQFKDTTLVKILYLVIDKTQPGFNNTNSQTIFFKNGYGGDKTDFDTIDKDDDFDANSDDVNGVLIL